MAFQSGGGNSSSSSKEKINHKQKEEAGGKMSSLAAVGVAVGVTAAALWGLSKLFGASAAEKEKMMKAPGRDYYIKRKDFENNPAGYFRDQRSK